MIEIITINIQNISKLVRSFLCVRTETKSCRISKPLNWNTHECHLSIIVQISKSPLPRVSKMLWFCKWCFQSSFTKKKKKKNLSCKVHLMNLHMERWENGVRLHRGTLKKANTSIASFLDSQLIFHLVLKAAYYVTVLQRQKPGQQSNTAVLLIKWIRGYFWKDRPLWCYHNTAFVNLYLSNQD